MPMPEPCSAFWKGAPDLSERFEVYLCSVAEKIRWKRARPFALRELRIHLLEQKEAFQDSGMAVEAAEEAAVREMGDAGMVGEALDRVHRPRPQWALICAAGLLALAGVFLRGALTAGWEHAAKDPVRSAAALALGLCAMVGAYLLDYTHLIRYGKKVYLGAVLLGLAALALSPRINGASYYTRYVVLAYPPVYAVWLRLWRDKGWKGLCCAILGGIPLAVIAGMAPYVTGVLLLLVTGFLLLMCAAGMDWFGVGREATAFAAILMAVLVSVPVLLALLESKRLTMLLHPEGDPLGRGYMSMAVRNMLSGAVWLGEGSTGGLYGGLPYESIVPEWENDCIMTTVAFKLGWLPFLILVGAVLGLMLALLVQGLRQENPFGRLLALSVIVPLCLQAAGAAALNLGWIIYSVSLPLMGGNLHTVLTMGMMGLALSVFRQQALPEGRCRPAEDAASRALQSVW